MLNDMTVIKLNKDILKRYEHNLKGGVLFLYHSDTCDVWVGNSSANNLINLLDGKRSLKEIYSILFPLFNNYEYTIFRENNDNLLYALIDKNFLEVVQR